MRHLFLIHSSITYLVAQGIIRHLALAPETCAYVLLRRFQPDPGDPVTARLALAQTVLVPLTWRVGQAWRKIAAFDAQIADLTADQPYALYVPHLDEPTGRLLYTNRRCRQVNYLEEGAAAYVPTARLPHARGLRDRVGRYLLSRGRVPVLGFYPEGYTTAYCVHPACFPDLARKTVLPLPFRRVAVTPDPSGQVVLVLDALVEFGIVGPEALRQALHELFANLEARGQRRLLFKYHPIQAQQPDRRAYYEREVFGPWADRLSFTELVAAVTLEDLAFSYPTAEFAVIISSVGLYARFCGCRVVSVARRLAALDPRFSTHLQLMPPVFFEEVEFIG